MIYITLKPTPIPQKDKLLKEKNHDYSTG